MKCCASIYLEKFKNHELCVTRSVAILRAGSIQWKTKSLEFLIGELLLCSGSHPKFFKAYKQRRLAWPNTICSNVHK